MDVFNLPPEEVMILREALTMYSHDCHNNIRTANILSGDMSQIVTMYEQRLKIAQKLTFQVYGLSK